MNILNNIHRQCLHLIIIHSNNLLLNSSHHRIISSIRKIPIIRSKIISIDFQVRSSFFDIVSGLKFRFYSLGKPSPGSGIPPPQTGYPPVRGYPPVNQSPAVPPQNEPLKPSNTYPSSSSAGPLPPTSTSNAVPQATYRYPYDQAYGPGPGVPPPQQQQHHPQHLKSEYPTTPSQLSPSAAGSWPPTSHQQQQRPQGPGPVPQGQSWPGSPQQRMAARPAFPSVKPEIYKGYSSPGPMIPSSSAPLPHAQNSKPLNSMLSSPLTPINQMASSAMALSNSAIHCVPQPTPFSQTALAAPPMPIKKEIVFPPDSVEAVSPVLTRRRKLHKVSVLASYLDSRLKRVLKSLFLVYRMMLHRLSHGGL